MFAGHVGAALAIGRIERRVNVGVFIIAALLLDSVLWLLVLIGWESVSIPQDFGVTHQPEYLFPYSHGLVASIGWSLVAAAAALPWSTRVPRAGWRIASLLALAVFSHWLLDAVVHQPELPIAGANSAKVGLGLWDSMSVALAVEAAIVLAGLWLFVAGATLSRGKRYAIIVLTLIILMLTIAGMTIAPPPPSASAMAASSLLSIVVICALACWLGRTPRATPG